MPEDGRPLRFPKEGIRALLLEGVHPRAQEAMEAEGYQVRTYPSSLPVEDLRRELEDVHLLGIRSATRLTDELLACAPRLLAVGAFCIGTKQAAPVAAAKRGVAVFNAPYSNTRSVVELAACEIVALSRGLFDKSAGAHAGAWDKTAHGSHEVRGRTLGIVGYGNIGSQLSVLAEMMGMRVAFYNTSECLALGNARKCASLEELLATSDVVSVHVDDRSENEGLFGDEQFRAMRDGALFINLSRGFVVDIEALREHLLSGKVGGAAVDVFPSEPKGRGERFESPLQGLPNVILSPHVGGSTEEAQEDIGAFVAAQLISFVNQGTTTLSVNLPRLSLPPQGSAHRLIHIHHGEVPGVMAQVNSITFEAGANVVGQYLLSEQGIGYVITDIEGIDAQESRAIEERLRAVPETIRVRALY
jgi:D-3-phosphoglycerate dehydrogenase